MYEVDDNIKNDLIRVLCDSIIVKLELAGDVIEPILVVFFLPC